MPSEKRSRKRAAREAKVAELERRRKRRSAIRRAIVVVVLAGVAVGLYALISSGGKKTASTTTTTASTTLPSNAVSSTTTVNLAGDTTSANCPTPFTATTALKKPKFSAAPPMIIDPTKSYSAVVTTDVGSFTIALDATHAPRTVNNFVFLAENHFFDCIVYHRVIPGFMNQSGDPTGSGSGGPGYQFADENFPSDATGYSAGEVAMANSGANTNGSQFFTLVGAYNPAKSGGSGDTYSLFGNVTSGMAVVQKINADGTQAGTPKKLHRMISVIITAS